jgi:hypothetical protein
VLSCYRAIVLSLFRHVHRTSVNVDAERSRAGTCSCLQSLLPRVWCPGRTFHNKHCTNLKHASRCNNDMFNLLNFKFGTPRRTQSKPHPYTSTTTNKPATKSQRANHNRRDWRPTSSSDHKRTTKLLQHANPSTASDMGKSNKFDCTNRQNEGVHLGKSIGDAALKELEKTRKDALRHASKARKSSTGSTTGDDGDINGVHFIDLVAPSKKLTDDGVAAMVAGLYEAMKRGNSQGSIALEGLDLRDNQLTTRALAILAPVVELAKNELKTIVLSDNAISVATDREALEWEAFLVAFKDCKTLRRLDLSGNRELGARALEVFSRVHCNEPAIEPIALGGDRSVYTLDELSESDDNKSVATDDIHNDDGAFDRMTSGGVLRRRCGLRSIPYISLKGIGLNDTGALWLSYILQEHHFPNQLLNELNAAPAKSSVEAYQQDAVEGGIDWRGNKDTLGKDGLALLTKVDAIRKTLTHLESSSSLAVCSEATSSTKSPPIRLFSRASIGSRRSSIRSIHTDDGGEHELTEIERLFKRIQRHIIEDRGINSVILWKVALTAVITSRKIAYIAPPAPYRRAYAGPCLFTSKNAADESSKGREERLDSAADIDINSPDGSDATSPPETITRRTGRSYAATLADPRTPGEPEFALTEVTNTPTTPKRLFKAHRKGAFSEGSDLQSLNEKLSRVDLQRVEDHRPERYLEWQQEKQEREEFEYRNTALACQLPLSVFNRILALTLSTDKWTIGPQDEVEAPKDSNQVLYPSGALLCDDQQREAYEWGQKRETLGRERRWAGMADSGQQLMLLDAIECLAYKSSRD